MSTVMNNNNTTIVDVNAPLFNNLAAMQRQYAEEVVRQCAAHFSFDAEDAIGRFIKERQLAKAPRVVKPKKPKEPTAPKVVKPPVPAFPLPWTGVANATCCSGLRLNHGLHTQCVMLPASTGAFCVTCQKMADANANGKPDHGTVEDRLAVGLNDYRCPKGKRSTPYTTVMKKLKITRESAETEARKMGVEIPEECFAERTPKRSKKDASASDTDSASSGEKKTGRPKNPPKQVVSETADDLIAALVAKANATPASVHQPESATSASVDQPEGGSSSDASDSDEPVAAEEKQAQALKKAAARRAAKKRRLEGGAELKAAADKLAAEKAAAEKAEAEKAAAEKAEAERLAAEKAEAEETEPPTVAVEVVRKGKKYLEQDGFLFDPETRDCAGWWNESTGQIEECDDDSDEE